MEGILSDMLFITITQTTGAPFVIFAALCL